LIICIRELFSGHAKHVSAPTLACSFSLEEQAASHKALATNPLGECNYLEQLVLSNLAQTQPS
jgi:hypothetical protein